MEGSFQSEQTDFRQFVSPSTCFSQPKLESLIKKQFQRDLFSTGIDTAPGRDTQVQDLPAKKGERHEITSILHLGLIWLLNNAQSLLHITTGNPPFFHAALLSRPPKTAMRQRRVPHETDQTFFKITWHWKGRMGKNSPGRKKY